MKILFLISFSYINTVKFCLVFVTFIFFSVGFATTLSDKEILIIDNYGNVKLGDGTIINDPLTDPRIKEVKRFVYPVSFSHKVPPMECETDSCLLGPFSVSDSSEVCFSPGNLQYHALLGTHETLNGISRQGTWRFAEHQYDFVGDETDGTVYYNGKKCNNSKIFSYYSTALYDGWIDMFVYGCSGYYDLLQPWHVENVYYDFARYWYSVNYNNYTFLIGEYTMRYSMVPK